MENKIIVENIKNKKEILKNSKKLIIEIDGNNINEWIDFYNIIQKKLDYWNYDEQFSKYHSANIDTYSDIVSDIIVFEKIKENKEEGIIISLDYTKRFKNIKKTEKEKIYISIFYYLLLQWYRDNKTIFQLDYENASINIEWYIFIDKDLLEKNKNDFQNEMIISLESGIKKLKEKFYDKKILNICFDENLNSYDIKEIDSKNLEEKQVIWKKMEEEKQSIFINSIKEKVENTQKEKKILMIEKFDLLNFNSRHSILLYIIDEILIKSYIKAQEIKIYSIFKDEI